MAVLSRPVVGKTLGEPPTKLQEFQLNLTVRKLLHVTGTLASSVLGYITYGRTGHELGSSSSTADRVRTDREDGPVLRLQEWTHAEESDLLYQRLALDSQF